MKKTNLISWIVAVLVLLIRSQSSSYNYVCVDPGHGGVDNGTHGRVYGVLEKDVNLGVGIMAFSYLVYYGWWPIMTRDEDIDIDRPHRANIANTANGGEGVKAFVSIHHNAPYDSTDTLTNGTETFWCNVDTTDSGWQWTRNTTDTLARKVYYRLRDQFHYPERGVQCLCDERRKILRLTKMASTLSEASFLTCAAVERKFYYNFNDECGKEGEAIFHGCSSYLRGFGIVTVTYAYEGGYYGQVIIDYKDTVTTPFVTCWESSEGHFLTCKGTMNLAGHTYTFNHWNHEWGEVPHDPNNCWHETDYDTTWYITTPYEHDHNYYAYMSGGPFSVNVVWPEPWAIWHVGEQRYIHWSASPGADSSSKVDIYLSRDGGLNWETIAFDLPYDYDYGGYWLWTVTGPVSTHCRVKITADDCAQNQTYDISNYDFSISNSGNNNPQIDQGLHCKYAQTECNDCIKYGESFTLEVHAHDDDHDSMYYEWHCGEFSGHFSNGQNVMTTAQNYVVYTAPTLTKQELYDYLSVAVTDVRGGQTWISGNLTAYPPGTNCLCGDVDGDGIIAICDIVYLIGYLLYSPPGPPPPEPIERADANNDGVVNVSDAVYLINYKLAMPPGPPPECCWIHD